MDFAEISRHASTDSLPQPPRGRQRRATRGDASALAITGWTQDKRKLRLNAPLGGRRSDETSFTFGATLVAIRTELFAGERSQMLVLRIVCAAGGAEANRRIVERKTGRIDAWMERRQ